MPTTPSFLSYKPGVADSISFRWPCKLIVNLSFAKYLAPKLSDTIISYPTLARGVVVRPLDDAVAVEVAAVPRPERVVLRALRKAVADDLRSRCASLGKRTRARTRAVLEQVSQETRSCSFPLPFSLKGVKGALLFSSSLFFGFADSDLPPVDNCRFIAETTPCHGTPFGNTIPNEVQV